MPVLFKIEDKQYQYPQGWQDVTLRQFLAFIDKVQPQKPKRAKRIEELTEYINEVEDKGLQDDLVYHEEYKQAKEELKQLEKGLTDEEYLLEYLPYKALYISHFCDFDAQAILHPAEIETLYQQIQGNLFDIPTYKDDQLQSITFEGIEYKFPPLGMRGAVLGEFLACMQIEVHFELIHKESTFAVIPHLMGVLLRPEGEVFDSTTAKKRAALFKDMTMDEAWKVYFFLQRLNIQLPVILKFFLGAEALFQAEQNQLKTQTIT
jgi:hypothetical protein